MSDDQIQKDPVKPLQELIAKDVNRKEFLRIVGFGSLALIGLGPLVHFLTGRSSKTINHIYNYKGSASTYNSGTYNR